MKYTCKISGEVLSFADFTGNNSFCLHPVFTLDIRELHKLSSSSTLTNKEQKLLLLAYLAQTGKVKFLSTIPLVTIPDSLADNVTKSLLFVADFLIHNPEYQDRFPDFSLSSENTSVLQEYLRELEQKISAGMYTTRRNYKEQDSFERALQARVVQRKSNFKQQVNSLLDSLLVTCPLMNDALYRQFQDVLLGKRNLVTDAMQKMKRIILDYAPEVKNNDALIKDAVIQRMDKIITKQLLVQIDLGMIGETEAKSQADSIAKSYTIEHDGEHHLNSAAAPAENLASIMEKLSNEKTYFELPASVTPPANVPTTRPQREDYKNKLAYIVALRKWEKMQ